jgi:hypothetical protein
MRTAIIILAAARWTNALLAQGYSGRGAIICAAAVTLALLAGCPAVNVPPGAAQVVVQPPVVYVYATMPAITIILQPGAIPVQVGDKNGPLISNTANITVKPSILGATQPSAE